MGGHIDLEVVVVLFIVATLKGINLLTSFREKNKAFEILPEVTYISYKDMFAERTSQG